MDRKCYVKGCTELSEFALSWRIRGPVEPGGPPDRIMPGYTNTVLHSCGVHVEDLRNVCALLFRDAP